jgi:hypothetical protein
VVKLADVHVGSPVVRGPLTVFPLFNGRAVADREYELYGSRVEVSELPDGPTLDHLLVTNLGATAALVLEGELLEGGWQHRVAARSTIVEPGQTRALAVYCVEHGRWDGGARGHSRGGRRATVQVRAAREQQEVWAQVRRYGESVTESLLETIFGSCSQGR